MAKVVYYDPYSEIVYYKDIAENFKGDTSTKWLEIQEEGERAYSYRGDQDGISKRMGRTVAETLRRQARSEYDKEVKALSEFFGCSIDSFPNWVLRGRISFKPLLEAVNEAFNFQDAVEKLHFRLQNEELGVSSDSLDSHFYNSLINNITEELTDFVLRNIEDLLNNRITNNDLRDFIDNAANNSLKELIPSLLKEQQRDRISAIDLSLIVSDSYDKLRNLMQTDNLWEFNINDLITRLQDNFNLNNSIDDMVWALRQDLNIQVVNKLNLTPETINLLTSYVQTALSGELILADGVSTAIMPDLSGVEQDFKEKLSRATDGQNLELILSMQERKTRDSYASIKRDLQRLRDNMKRSVKDRLFIYERQINYDSNELKLGNSSFRLPHFRNFLREIQFPNADRLIDYLRQTMPGAIYEGQTTNASISLARATANFLFDDFKVLGETAGLNTIHLYNIQGVYLPLSYILSTIADSFSKLNDPTSYVNFDFNYGDNPLYTAEDYPMKSGRTKRGSEERWAAQAKQSDEIIVTVTFLQNFKELIERDLM